MSRFLFFFIFCLCVLYSPPGLASSYWLWAGLTAQDIPEEKSDEIYIYQGLITTYKQKTAYRALGLYPSPLQAGQIFLVYRLEGDLPHENRVVELFERRVLWWQQHHKSIVGMQLDFDAPTSRMLRYSHFLKRLRQRLSPAYKLSITGLGDWAMYGNRQAMGAIAQTTHELIFQLYQGRHSLENSDRYVSILKHYPFPFRVGFLRQGENKKHIDILKTNPYFQGVVYFIQKNY